MVFWHINVAGGRENSGIIVLAYSSCPNLNARAHISVATSEVARAGRQCAALPGPVLCCMHVFARYDGLQIVGVICQRFQHWVIRSPP